MRVTSFMIYNQFVRSLQRNLTHLSDSNEKLATGKKINKPSDDVIGITRALDYKLSINLNNQYMRNIDEAVSHLEFTEMKISTVADTLTRIKELLLIGVSDNTDALGRKSISNEVAQLRDHLLDLANSKFRNRYMFSGFRTDVQSFNAVTYDYQGDQGTINVMINKDSAVPINTPGTQIFGYIKTSPEEIRLNDGTYVHYIPVSGTTIRVEIRDVDNTTILDEFSYSNVMQMTNILSSALNDNNLRRIKALMKPYEEAFNNVINYQAYAGAILNRLDNQIANNEDSVLNLKTVLSNTEDVDLAEIISTITKHETAIQALRQSSVNQLTQSLFDFLR
ncbi:MAG: flagellar hook-associated protein FlgL [Thermodesulfovibrionales bacterium]|nr:flagellar hook-associated protein FlgL [Thermodesulfovibrionales bacterium]